MPARIRELPRQIDHKVIEKSSKWVEKEKKRPGRNQFTESEAEEAAADLEVVGQQEVICLDKVNKETVESTFK